MCNFIKHTKNCPHCNDSYMSTIVHGRKTDYFCRTCHNIVDTVIIPEEVYINNNDFYTGLPGNG